MPLSEPAPAKVNLGLHVLRRRADGYHDIETVFQPLAWADTVQASERTDAAYGGLALTTSDPALPTDRGNLVWRAAEALAAWAGITPEARLHLEKRVPYGAGLGSGSSDAAATLRLLARLWRLDVPPEALHALAAGLGADVPFFLGSGPALGTGTGTDLAPLRRPDGSRWRSPFWLVVAVPPVHVSTAEAYRGVTPEADGRPDLAAAVTSDDLSRWRREVVNDFEPGVVARHPAVGEALAVLKRHGAGWSALSGSGSAVVGAFESGREARAAFEEAEASGARAWMQAPEASGVAEAAGAA